MKQPYVYILASAPRGTLYIGVTGQLRERIWQHRMGLLPGFTSRYAVHRLVWFEAQPDFPSAIHRETCIKRWRRLWKLQLVEASNPQWHDLWDDIAP